MEGGAQPITLQKHCRDPNVIVHEIGNNNMSITNSVLNRPD